MTMTHLSISRTSHHQLSEQAEDILAHRIVNVGGRNCAHRVTLYLVKWAGKPNIGHLGEGGQPLAVRDLTPTLPQLVGSAVDGGLH